MNTTTVLEIIKMLDKQINIYSPADTDYSLGRVDVCTELRSNLQSLIEAELNEITHAFRSSKSCLYTLEQVIKLLDEATEQQAKNSMFDLDKWIQDNV